jgi:hypothetical protein
MAATIFLPIGQRGSRTFVIHERQRGQGGKPFAEARIRRDQIATYVRELQPGKLSARVLQAAVFFGVTEQTVWNALKADRTRLDGPIDLGPVDLQWMSTGYF